MAEQADSPLKGVTILAVEQYGAGPYGTMLLADLGATVIKIEDPVTGGDVARYVPPYRGDADSVYFQAFNRRKQSVAIDTRTESGQRIFLRLVQNSDVVFSNLRGDQVAKRGLEYEQLKDTNPRIVCCALTGFGPRGPRQEEPAYDYLMQAYAGWMSLTGDPSGPPQKAGLSLVDFSAGIAAALGTVATLFRARETGVGGDVDVSLYSTAISLLTYVGTWHLTSGYEPVRLADSAHPSQVPSQVFPTKNGWLVVMCAKEKFFRRLIEELGLPHLAEDPRFDSFDSRLVNRDELIPLLQEVTRQRTTEDWLEVLRGKVPCAPVQTVDQALQDPQTLALNLISEFEHPDFGRIRGLASPISVSGDESVPTRGPRLGEHTVEVLVEKLGMDRQEVNALAADGVIYIG